MFAAYHTALQIPGWGRSDHRNDTGTYDFGTFPADLIELRLQMDPVLFSKTETYPS